MNIEEDPCTCGGPDYGVFGDANMCDYCLLQAYPRRKSPREIDEIARLRRRQAEQDHVSRDFNSYMIELFNQRNK